MNIKNLSILLLSGLIGIFIGINYYNSMPFNFIALIKTINWENMIFAILGALITFYAAIFYENKKKNNYKNNLINYLILEMSSCKKSIDNNDEGLIPNLIARKIIEDNILDPVNEKELAISVYEYYKETVIINKSIIGTSKVNKAKKELSENIKIYKEPFENNR